MPPEKEKKLHPLPDVQATTCCGVVAAIGHADLFPCAGKREAMICSRTGSCPTKNTERSQDPQPPRASSGGKLVFNPPECFPGGLLGMYRVLGVNYVVKMRADQQNQRSCR
ncbi:hypothetical protein CLAIMM_14463 [Cladophialophora immunda]|nr:hypothetical protein CLAIMM_14463 [Cladophialophora immunda]